MSEDSEASQVAALDTVLFRFASSDDAKLPTAAARVLPRILPMLDRNSAKVRAKVMEILKHLNGRLKDVWESPSSSSSSSSSSSPSASKGNTTPSPSLLPVGALLDVFANSSSILTKTFSLVYIAKGFPMLEVAERASYLPRLLQGVSNIKRAALRAQVLHTFASVLPGFDWRNELGSATDQLSFLKPLPSSSHPKDSKTKGEAVDTTATHLSRPDRECVVLYILDLMLFSKNFVGSSKGLPSPGLSPEGHKQLSDLIKSTPVCPLPSAIFNEAQLASSAASKLSKLATLKRGALGLTLSGILPASEALPLILAAAGTSGGADSYLRGDAESYLRRMGGVSSVAATFFGLDKEELPASKTLLRMFLGDVNEKIPEKQRRRGAHLGLRTVLIRYLCQSKVAANSIKETVKVVFECLFSPGSNDKLRQEGLQYLKWSLKSLRPTGIARACPVFFKGLLKLIQIHKQQRKKLAAGGNKPAQENKKAGPTFTPIVVASTYAVLGEICAKMPKLCSSSHMLFELFVKDLDAESSEIISSHVYEGLLSLVTAYSRGAKKVVLNAIKIFLLKKAKDGIVGEGGKERSGRSRLAIVECSNRLFPFIDVDARFICLTLSDDPTLKVRRACEEGLKPLSYTFTSKEKAEGTKAERSESVPHPEKKRKLEDNNTNSADAKVDMKTEEAGKVKEDEEKEEEDNPAPSTVVQYPDFSRMTALVHRQHNESSLRDSVLRKSLNFLTLCLTFNAREKSLQPKVFASQFLLVSGDSERNTSLFKFQSLVEHAFASRDKVVVSEAARSLLGLVRWAPEQFSKQYSERKDWLKSNLVEGSKDTRESIGSLLDVIKAHMDLEGLLSLLDDLVKTEVEPRASKDRMKDLSTDTNALCGGILGAGILAAEYISRVQKGGNLADVASAFCQHLSNLLSHGAPSVVSSSCKALQRLGREALLPLPEGTWQQSPDEKDVKKLVKEIDEHPTRCSVFRKLLDLASSAATKDGERGEARVPEEAVRAIGKIVRGDERKEWRQRGFNGLLGLRNSSFEELHFAVGEALVDVAGGPKGEGLGYIVDKLLLSYVNQGSAVQRASACTWLLCVVKYGAGNLKLEQTESNAIRGRAQKIQKAFSIALTESRQLTQECASKGLAVLYEIGDEKMKGELVEDLTRVFKAGTRKVNKDTEIKVGVGANSGGGATDSGKMATYSELCTMASDIGQPNLVYEFLDLAAHHSVWNSKSGAAFSLGSILKASERLRPSLESLIPKLFRYKHDPDPKIRASMEELWNNLMTDSKTGRKRHLEPKHFRAVLKELLSSMGKSQWRVRQSAATATASLMSGVKSEQIIPELEAIWRAMFRLIDDRKDTVRNEGFMLARTLSNLSERLSNPTYTRKTHVRDALKVLIPMLAGADGMTHKVKEVQGVSVGALVRIIKAAGSLVAPHLPLLVTALLSAMSTLEPQAFSYMQFHASSVDMTEEQLEKLRIQAVAQSPLQEALDTCLDAVSSDPDVIPAVSFGLKGLVRQGLGLSTLTGAARFAARLIVQARLNASGPEMKEKLQQASGELLRAFTKGLQDPSATVRKEYARTIGQLCAVGKPKDVLFVTRSVVRLYTNAELKKKGDEDYEFEFPQNFTESSQRSRLSAGEVCKHMTTKALEMAKRFHKELLPVAFVALHDPDVETKEAWEVCWNDCTYGTKNGLDMYIEEVVALCVAMFKSPSYFLKKMSVTTLDHAVTLAKENPRLLSKLDMISKLVVGALESTKHWNNKKILFSLAGSLAKYCGKNLPKDVRVKLVTAIPKHISNPGRGGREHRIEALKCAGTIALAFPEYDCFKLVQESVEPLLRDPMVKDSSKHSAGLSSSKTEADAKKMGTKEAAAVRTGSGISENSTTSPIVRAAAMRCLGQCWPKRESLPDSYRTMCESTSWILKEILKHQKGYNWNVKAAALESLRLVVSTIYIDSSGVRPPALSNQDGNLVVQAAMEGLDDEKHATVRTKALEAVAEIGKRGASMKSLLGVEWERLLGKVSSLLTDKIPNVMSLADRILKEHFKK